MLNLKTDKMKTIESGINKILVDNENKIISINGMELWNVDIILNEDWEDAMSCFIDNVLNEIMLEQLTSLDEIVEKVIEPQWKIWDMDSEYEFTTYDVSGTKIQIGTGCKVDEHWKYSSVITPMVTIKIKA
jgi:hypothetical protein